MARSTRTIFLDANVLARVKLTSIHAFLEAERVHMEAGMEEFSRLQDELGLVE